MKCVSEERDLQHHLGSISEEMETVRSKWFQMEPGFLIISSENYNSLLMKNSSPFNQHVLTECQALCYVLKM